MKPTSVKWLIQIQDEILKRCNKPKEKDKFKEEMEKELRRIRK